MENSILIVGPGAIGGLLAATAAKSGLKAYLLARSPKSEQLLVKKGIKVKMSSGKSEIIRKNILSARFAKKDLPACVAFFCVKGSDLTGAIQSANKFIGPKTAISFLQNGIGHESRARASYGKNCVVIGTAYFASEKMPEGMIIHHGGRKIHLAQNPSNAAAISIVRKTLLHCGWEVVMEKNESQMLWTKLCLNAAINPIGALAHASNGEIMKNPGLKKISYAALKEAVLAAQSAGQKTAWGPMKSKLSRICPTNSLQKNSMLQDMENHRKTEIRQILGPLLSAAKKHNIRTPILSRMFRLIQNLEGYS